MKSPQIKFQIGKNGVTDGVVESLALALKNNRQIRVSVLKSSGRDRDNIENMANELKEKLPIPSNFRIIGFTIIVTRSPASSK